MEVEELESEFEEHPEDAEDFETNPNVGGCFESDSNAGVKLGVNSGVKLSFFRKEVILVKL